MTQGGLAGECGELEGIGRTVVVGVKLDSPSKELLNWALVKVAEKGDRVIAVHVLGGKVDRDGKSSLISMVQGFDAALAVYEGFCNLKQVDLKLKICRGSSVKKVLVREALSYLATDVVVGTAQTHRTIGSSKSVAKYCASKLSKTCSIIAVDNGRIVFKREATKGLNLWHFPISGIFTEEDDRKRRILRTISDPGSTQKGNCAICSPRNLQAQEKESCQEQFPGFQWRLDEDPYELDDRSGSIEELDSFIEKYSSICKLFTYHELQQATSNFNAENLIGTGGSSHVYRGSLLDGREVAVKVLNPLENTIKEFKLEIEMTTALNHKNIISLSGFCLEDTNLLLVYDFLPRGNLEDNLHRMESNPVNENSSSLGFGWKERYKVAMGVAEALTYLHIGIEKPMIHGDVKLSNILLSIDFDPQLSDFGLAKWASVLSSDMACSDVAGTFGYLAPEYFMYGKVNEKIDVYAFGVVLLELVSGRKPVNSDLPKGQDVLVLWAERIMNSGKVSELVDPRLGDDYDSGQMECMVLAASLCIRRQPQARPSMEMVLKLLKGGDDDDEDVIRWAKMEMNCGQEQDEELRSGDLQSHLNLVFREMDDDDDESSLSLNSFEQNAVSVEDYLKGRCSRRSSFA